MRIAIGGLFTLFLAIFASAVSAQVTYDTSDKVGLPWYLIALWVACAVVAGLLALAFLAWGTMAVRHYLSAIEILNDWRCTYWTKEQQLKVTLWFKDKLYANQYHATCVVKVGPQSILLDDDVDLGGTYMGRREMHSGHSGPVMAEFLKKDIALEDPESATVNVSIEPRDQWGAGKKKTKIIPIQIVNHGTDEADEETQEREPGGR